MYDNEEEVGQAIAEKIEDGTIKREDIFVTTKVCLFSLLFEVYGLIPLAVQLRVGLFYKLNSWKRGRRQPQGGGAVAQMIEGKEVFRCYVLFAGYRPLSYR